MVEGVRGRVIEFGCGRGSSAPCFAAGRHTLCPVIGLERSVMPLRTAERRFASARVAFSPVASSVEQLPIAGHSVDVIVMCFVMCSVADPGQMLREAARVLRPDGTLRFAEHGLAPAPVIAHIQRGLTPIWRRIAGGCCLDRDVLALFRAHGFAVDELSSSSSFGDPLTHVYRGVARVRP